MKTAVYDVELIGRDKPVFLVNVIVLDTNERFSFWHHKRGHTAKLEKMLLSGEYEWVSFNGIDFDDPLIAAAIMGHDEYDLKIIARHIIDTRSVSWATYKEFNLDYLEYKRIDLREVAPGVMVSLKTYMGRMGCKTLQDLPYHYDTDLDEKGKKVTQDYCFNDCEGTAELFKTLSEQIELRRRLSEEYGLDLMSKSDAQIAEAILKKRLNIGIKPDVYIPRYVTYTAPEFIKTKHPVVSELIETFENSEFEINRANGSPLERGWMKTPVHVGEGYYKVGLGGLHSQHDVNFYAEATENYCISDFDVASYYPNIMMKCGLIPRMGGNKGELFLQEYTKLYEQRMEAKRAGNKAVANSLKICLNGTFGKLGSIFSAFYSPDLLLAVTITGQLNLLCLIAELEAIKGVKVFSANTDGITVGYPVGKRNKVVDVFVKNAKRTEFEYEETRYAKIAMKDVNNYIAVTTEGFAVIVESDGSIKEVQSKGGKLKRKGLYAATIDDKGNCTLQKNPTMEVCSNAAAEYLRSGYSFEAYIRQANDFRNFLSVRNVKGGGIQHLTTELRDDWFEIAPGNWSYPGKTTAPVKRKSRPAPYEVGVNGKPFGRVARWYMTKKNLPPITYLDSGNKVPKTEGAMLCMTLPKNKPSDLDYEWYINETKSILRDLGVVNSDTLC